MARNPLSGGSGVVEITHSCGHKARLTPHPQWQPAGRAHEIILDEFRAIAAHPCLVCGSATGKAEPRARTMPIDFNGLCIYEWEALWA